MLVNLEHWDARVDLAAAFRWTARLNMHEGVANHFSFAVNEDGTKFLMNPNKRHFSLVNHDPFPLSLTRLPLASLTLHPATSS